MIIAARVAGVQRFDTVFTKLDDLEGFRQESEIPEEILELTGKEPLPRWKWIRISTATWWSVRSDGIITGAQGGHPDTVPSVKRTIVIAPLRSSFR